jgi:PEP-CTERM motif
LAFRRRSIERVLPGRTAAAAPDLIGGELELVILAAVPADTNCRFPLHCCGSEIAKSLIRLHGMFHAPRHGPTTLYAEQAMHRQAYAFSASVACMVVAALAAACFALPATAIPLTLAEGADLPNSPGTNIGTLDVGFNSITGHVNGVTDLADYFEVFLPAALTVTRYELDVTGFTYGSYTTSAGTIFTRQDGFFSTNGLDFFDRAESVAGDVGYFTVGPFFTGPSTFSFEFLSPQMLGVDAIIVPAGFDYSVTFTVESNVVAVPEPGTLLLTAGGLGMLLARRRRKTT